MPTQQKAVYAAQANLPLGPAVTLEEAQIILDSLRDTHWWETRYADHIARVEVGPAVNPRQSCGWYDPEMHAGRIELCPGGMNVRTIAHELAHVTTTGSKAHDPEWVREYGKMLYWLLGSDVWATWLQLCKDFGIEMAP